MIQSILIEDDAVVSQVLIPDVTMNSERCAGMLTVYDDNDDGGANAGSGLEKHDFSFVVCQLGMLHKLTGKSQVTQVTQVIQVRDHLAFGSIPPFA